MIVRSDESIGLTDRIDERRENLDRLREDLAALPVEKVEDGFSNRDHDEILYGKSPRGRG